MRRLTFALVPPSHSQLLVVIMVDLVRKRSVLKVKTWIHQEGGGGVRTVTSQQGWEGARHNITGSSR